MIVRCMYSFENVFISLLHIKYNLCFLCSQYYLTKLNVNVLFHLPM